MSTARAQSPALRLVNGGRAPRASVLPGRDSAAGRVRSENRAAAGLDPHDARWALAVRASQMLEGGSAAILAPERRRTLIAMAVGMGLRAFDANLVIAIVQDAARCGLPPLGETTESRLLLIARPSPRAAKVVARAGDTLVLFAASGLLAAGLFLGLIAWIG